MTPTPTKSERMGCPMIEKDDNTNIINNINQSKQTNKKLTKSKNCKKFNESVLFLGVVLGALHPASPAEAHQAQPPSPTAHKNFIIEPKFIPEGLSNLNFRRFRGL